MLIYNTNKVIPSSKKLGVIRELIKEGTRVFRRSELEARVANELGLTYGSFGVMLHSLAKEGWITQIRKGIYLMEYTATPIYEQEIAMALVKPAMLSHGSAFRYHDLTDQPLNKVYITTTNSIFVPSEGKEDRKKTAIEIRGINYEFIRIKQEKFFGGQTAWCGDGKFIVTDLERTLLDGLSHPQYCGGLQEVVYAYREYFDQVNLNKIIDYALRIDVATSRRLGWILDRILAINSDQIYRLIQKADPGYRLLDPGRPDTGSYDPKWKIRLNHHGDW
jgi:predicted transcriptional regulator of viral defense system